MRVPRLSRASCAVLLVAAALAAAAGTRAPDPGFGGALDVQLSLAARDGTPLESPVAGEPFRVQVWLADPASGRPVEDEHPSAWIRPVATSNSRCSEAARAYFVNQGALPRGSTDLARSLYAVSHEDGTVSIIDWEHSIASANILAVAEVKDLAGPIAPLRPSFAFVALTKDGRRVHVDAAEGTSPRPMPTADRTTAPSLVSANGWVAQGRWVFPPDDSASLDLGDTVIALSSALPDEELGVHDGVLALLDPGVAVLIPEDGRPEAPVEGPPGATWAAHAASADATLFVDGGSELVIVYGGNREVRTPLPAMASRVSVSPDGALALAWSRDSRAVSIIEIATATVVQAVEVNRPPVDQTIREVAFARGAAFLLLDRLDFVMVLDLALARRGVPAALRPVRIGPPVEDLPEGAGPFLVETARGHAGGTVLALHPDLSTAFPVMRDSGNTTAPMNGFRIRGARPQALAELNGALRERAPGLYEGATVLARGGPHELVVSGGPGRFTACARFDVEGEAEEGLVLRLEAEVGQRDENGLALDLRVMDASGTAQAWPADLPLILQSLEGGWRARTVARPVAPDRHRAVLADIPPGQISIAFDRALPPEVTIAPATIQVPR